MRARVNGKLCELDELPKLDKQKKHTIAVVQSPQDYRDQNESTFKKLCYAEYKGFFQIRQGSHPAPGQSQQLPDLRQQNPEDHRLA